MIPRRSPRAIEAARRSDQPSLIACKTIIGYGAPTQAGHREGAWRAAGRARSAKARARALDWPHLPFEIPDDIVARLARDGASAAPPSARSGCSSASARSVKRQALRGKLQQRRFPSPAIAPLSAFARASPRQPQDGDASGFAAGARRNFARASQSDRRFGRSHAFQPDQCQGQQVGSTRNDFSGSYLHYGVREFGMAAAMNGIALHGGMIPYGGTFLAFADYNRPAIRLAALMGVRVDPCHDP